MPFGGEPSIGACVARGMPFARFSAVGLLLNRWALSLPCLSTGAMSDL